MATDVEICSNACLLLGAATIAAINPPENTPRATLAANLYPMLRSALLRAHLWNPCIKRVALTAEASTPAFDWSFQFPLPTDWIRTLQVGQYGAEVPYKTEGRKLLADDNPLYLRYVADVDEGQWDAQMVYCMTLAMAAAMAYPITKSAALAKEMNEKALQAIKQAQTIDGQDDEPETLGDFRLLLAGYTDATFLR